VKVSGDGTNPMFAKVDLSHLPDEDIHALARILPKLGGGTAGPPPIEAPQQIRRKRS
jgi:hypothetical protein